MFAAFRNAGRAAVRASRSYATAAPGAENTNAFLASRKAVEDHAKHSADLWRKITCVYNSLGVSGNWNRARRGCCRGRRGLAAMRFAIGSRSATRDRARLPVMLGGCGVFSYRLRFRARLLVTVAASTAPFPPVRGRRELTLAPGRRYYVALPAGELLHSSVSRY